MINYDLMHKITIAGDTSIDAALRAVVKLCSDAGPNKLILSDVIIETIEREL